MPINDSFNIGFNIALPKIQFKNIIQLKENSADSIQKIIQFNSQGLFDTGRIGKVPKNCPKSVQNRQKGTFHQKWQILIQNMIHIHFTIKFNSKDYSISFFQEYSIPKKI